MSSPCFFVLFNYYTPKIKTNCSPNLYTCTSLSIYLLPKTRLKKCAPSPQRVASHKSSVFPPSSPYLLLLPPPTSFPLRRILLLSLPQRSSPRPRHLHLHSTSHASVPKRRPCHELVRPPLPPSDVVVARAATAPSSYPRHLWPRRHHERKQEHESATTVQTLLPRVVTQSQPSTTVQTPLPRVVTQS